MPFVWSVGTILGPCIGGYFATPVQNFPGTFSENGIFAKFPYLLPNLICAGLMVVSIVAGWLCLEETHPEMQPWSRRSEHDEQPFHIRADSSIMTTQPSYSSPAVNLTQESYGTFNDVSEEAIEEEWDVKADGTTRGASVSSASSQKVFTKRVIMLTVALGIFTYHSMTYDHLLPIFFQDDRVPAGSGEIMNTLSAAASNEHGSLAGGLGLSIKDVGVIMSFNGIIALVVQAVVFPLAASWLGIWKVFLAVTILHPIAYFIVPFLALLPPDILYAGIYTCLTIRNCLSILAYPVLLILIKEASPGPSSLGRINGLAASTGAACRTMASPVAGFLYGVGIKIDLTAIAWWASALVAVAGAVQALTIRREDSGPRHQVHAVSFAGESEQHQRRKHRPSIVRIRVQGSDSGYASEDERTPLVRPEA